MRSITAMLVAFLTLVIALSHGPVAANQLGNGGQFGSGPSGDYRETLPIEVPSYRGLEPALSLSYSSSTGDGWLGIGWRLSGLSSIQRVSSGRGAPSYTSDDVFLLDGAELIPCAPGLDSPSCRYPASQLHRGYATRIESYRRIAYDPRFTTWYVWNKDGTRYTYEPRHLQSPAETYAWDLTEVQDTLGNRVHYVYWQETAAGIGETYLKSIYYGGFLVQFHYEPRPDTITYANGQDLVYINYRLRSIDVSANGARARVYALRYIQRGETRRSFLAEVQQYGRDAELGADGEVINAASAASLPPVFFEAAAIPSSTWSAHEVSDSQWGLPIEGGPPLTVLDGVAVPIPHPFPRLMSANLGDFDGDGRTDWAMASPNLRRHGQVVRGEVLFSVALSGKRAPIYVQTTLPWSFAGISFIKQVFSSDVNGDGRTDLVFLVGGASIPGEPDTIGAHFLGLVTALAQGDGTFVWAASDAQATSWETRESTINRVTNCSTGDVDGDRRQDVVCSFTKGDGTHHMGIALARANGLFHIAERPTYFREQGPTRQMALGDTNGDGLADPMFLDVLECRPDTSGCSYNYYELVTGLLLDNANYQFERQSTDWELGEPTFFAADINGDGKADYVLFKSGADGAIQTAMRQPDGSFLLNRQAVPNVLITDDHSVSVGDANGDGKMDLLVLSRQPPGVRGCSTNIRNAHVNLHRVLSHGNGFFALPTSWTDCSKSRELDISWDELGSFPVQPEAGDLNGDGTADFIIAVAQRNQDFITLREDLSPHPMDNAFDWKTAEVDGDGKKDWIYIRTLISTLASTDTTYRPIAQNPIPGTEAFTVVRNWRVMDVDADGRDDLVYLSYVTPDDGIRIGVWFSQGNGSWRFAAQQVLVGAPEVYRDTLNWRPMDVNGDGRVDLVHVRAEGLAIEIRTLLSNGDGSWFDRSDTAPLPYSGGDTLNWRPADVNGDGKADLVHVAFLDPGVRISTLLSKGDGSWVFRSSDPTEAWRNSRDGLQLLDIGFWMHLDVNGDGKTDLVHLWPMDRRPGQSTPLRVHTLLSNGSGWRTRVTGL